MAQYIKLATPLNPFFFAKHFQHSTPLSSACCFWKHKLDLLPQLNFTSTAMSHCKDNTEDHSLKYNWINGIENLEKYKPKGYHPIMIGDVLHDCYHIVDKLGFGDYSTVWLAQDRYQEEYVAIKIGIANLLPQKMKCLQALSASSLHPSHNAIPFPLDEFKIHGPNGAHICYIMVPAQCNLREISFSCLFSLNVAQALVSGLTMAVSHMHSCRYVHGGLLLSFGSGSLQLIFCDRYSSSQYSGQASI